VGGCSAAHGVAPKEQSLIAVGRAIDDAGNRVRGAVVAMQALWPARSGGRRGGTGQDGIGERGGGRTADDGEVGVALRLNPPTTQICLIAYGTLPGDSVWRDTAAVLSNLKIVEAGVVPDTARFDLTLLK